MQLKEHIRTLGDDAAEQLIEQRDASGARIGVFRNEHYRWMTLGGPSIQGMMLEADPVSLVLPTHRAMMICLLLQPGARRLLNLGSGTGAIERFLQSRAPELRLTSVDSNPLVTALARRYFLFPENHLVVDSAAEDFLLSDEIRYDIILVDIFEQERLAPCLYQSAFHCALLGSLNSEGVVCLNLIASEQEYLSMLRTLRGVFRWLWLLHIPGYDNLLVYCFRSKPPSLRRLKQQSHALSEQTGLDLAEFIERMKALPEDLSGNTEK